MVFNAGSGTDMPDVSIMLVNWNTRELTLEALRSVFRETHESSFEIILVDNASSDGSVDSITAEFPDIVMMAEDTNHGFAKATNMSVERARGEYVLLLNTDTVVLDGAIDKLIAFARRTPHARIWGGRTVFEDGTLNPDSSWGRITPWSLLCMGSGLTKAFPHSALFNPEGYGGWLRDSEREIDVVQGSFFLIERKFWNELGGFDPAFYMFCEEADLCARARKLGASPRMTPEATIVHHGGRSTKARADRIVYMSGGRTGLVDRHFAPCLRRPGKAVIAASVGWRAFAYSLAAKFRPELRETARQWSEAWRRRDEWKDGPPSRGGG